jgi:hypothetical protein
MGFINSGSEKNTHPVQPRALHKLVYPFGRSNGFVRKVDSRSYWKKTYRNGWTLLSLAA